jgi:hypothetical protein
MLVIGTNVLELDYLPYLSLSTHMRMKLGQVPRQLTFGWVQSGAQQLDQYQKRMGDLNVFLGVNK